ncbi:MAG: substrate-binding domain-containing protein [Pseudomonadota bacterium]
MIRLALILALFAGPAVGAERFVTVASTTSTQNSGLLGAILPVFTAETGIDVRVIAVGTGQALRIARNGDADLLLVHHRPSEEAFVAEGYGLARRDVMYNDFVIVGPPEDPAGIAEAGSAAEALSRIAAQQAPFLSRGDDSGTHKKELSLWAAAAASPGTPDWYREAGAGMGTTLNIAVAMGAYALTDRGTWITFGNKGGHVILTEGDPALYNPYGVIVVSPERHPHVNVGEATELADWLTSPAGQAEIAGFTILGQQAFCPNSEPRPVEEEERAQCPVHEESGGAEAHRIRETAD